MLGRKLRTDLVCHDIAAKHQRVRASNPQGESRVGRTVAKWGWPSKGDDYPFVVVLGSITCAQLSAEREPGKLVEFLPRAFSFWPS